MKRVTLILAGIALIAFTLTSCNNTKQEKQEKTKVANENSKKLLTGTYICTEHWNDDLIGNTKITFTDDGKVNFSGIANTSYRINGDSVFMDMHTYEMGFKIDGNTLRASGNAGNVVYTKK